MNFPKAKKITTQRYEGGLSKIPGVTKSIKLSSNESALGCSSLALQAFIKTKNKISKYLRNRSPNPLIFSRQGTFG